MSGYALDMFESLVDRRVREAMERGDFDDLRGSGKPLPGSGRPYEPNWWVRSYLERERSEDRRRAEYERIEARLGALWALGSEDAVRNAVERLNAEVAELDGGPDRLEPFDVESVVTAWKAMVRARAGRST